MSDISETIDAALASARDFWSEAVDAPPIVDGVMPVVYYA